MEPEPYRRTPCSLRGILAVPAAVAALNRALVLDVLQALLAELCGR